MTAPHKEAQEISMTPQDVEILYQDEAIVVVNKPSGLLVHRGWGRDEIVMLGLVRNRVGAKIYPVHRLDRATSGVLLFALSSQMAAIISGYFSRRDVSKRYITLVSGTPDPTLMLDCSLPRRKDGPRVPSCTLVRRLYAMEYYSIIEAVPLTGRLHQIRKHLHHAEHAVIGDKKYGYRWKNNFNREKFGLERMALHAWALSLPHPTTQEMLSFCAPLPDSLLHPFQRMRVPQRVWDDLYADPLHPWVSQFPAHQYDDTQHDPDAEE